MVKQSDLNIISIGANKMAKGKMHLNGRLRTPYAFLGKQKMKPLMDETCNFF